MSAIAKDLMSIKDLNVMPPTVALYYWALVGGDDYDYIYIRHINEYELNALRILILKGIVDNSAFVLKGKTDKVLINSDGTIDDWNELPFSIIQQQLAEIFRLQSNKKKRKKQ